MIRDSIPYVVMNSIINKDIGSNISYKNQKVRLAKLDSTNLNSWKKDWQHPKFYINISKFEVVNNMVNVEIFINSIGLWILYSYKLSGDDKLILLSSSYRET